MIGKRTFPLIVAAILSLIVCGVTRTAPGADDSKPKEPPSLDKQLLDDLGGDLLEGLDLPPAGPANSGEASKDKTPQKPTSGRPSRPTADGGEDSGAAKPGEGSEPSATDEQLLDQLIDGEDVDLSGNDDPILDLGRRMKEVERMIGQRNTSAGTQQMQRQIAADIAALIEKLRQQRQQPSPGSSRQSPKEPQPGQRQPEPGQRDSDKPAEESQDRTGDRENEPLEIGVMEDLLKDVWGHLPERVRRQMLSGSGERVLPKYQKLIEQYYKRLAEDAEKYP
jgi:hypothetical protein